MPLDDDCEALLEADNVCLSAVSSATTIHVHWIPKLREGMKLRVNEVTSVSQVYVNAVEDDRASRKL